MADDTTPDDVRDVTAAQVEMVIHTDRYLASWDGTEGGGIAVYRDAHDWSAFNDPIGHVTVEPDTPRTAEIMAVLVSTWCRANPGALAETPGPTAH